MAELVKDEKHIIILCDCGLTHVITKDESNQLKLKSIFKKTKEVKKDDESDKENKGTGTEETKGKETSTSEKQESDSWL